LRDEQLEEEVRGIMRSAKPLNKPAPSVVVHGNVQNLSAGDMHIHQDGCAVPDRTDIPVHAGRICMQCGLLTWKRTRNCIHCDFDLFQEDARLRDLEISARMLRIAVFFGGLGLCLCVLSSSHIAVVLFPKIHWMFGLMGLLLLGMAMKSSDEAQRYRKKAQRLG
jgi:hypothetical protein